MDAFEVAKHQIECERLQLTVYLLGEGIGQKCEQTDRQQYGQFLTPNIASTDVLHFWTAFNLDLPDARACK